MSGDAAEEVVGQGPRGRHPEDAPNPAIVLRLTGPLDIVALEPSIAAALPPAPGTSSAFSFERLDLSAVDDAEAALDDLVDRLRASPVGADGPGLHAVLGEFGGDRYALALACAASAADDHVVLDLARRVVETYDARARTRGAARPDGDAAPGAPRRRPGARAPAPEPPRWWVEELQQAFLELDLPFDRPGGDGAAWLGHRRPLTLDPAVAEAVAALAVEERVPVEPVLLAAYGALLGRYADADSVWIGLGARRARTPAGAAADGSWEEPVVRVDLSPDPTFRELVAAVHARMTLADALPAPECWPATGRGNPADHTSPGRRAAFVREQHLPQGRLASGLEWRLQEAGSALAAADAVLGVRTGGRRLDVALTGRRSAFTAGTVARIAGHYAAQLASLSAAPDGPLSRASFVTHDERARLVHTLSGIAAAGPPPARCAVELFEARARERPDATALVWGNQRWTYAHLDERASMIGRVLRDHGASREARVGVGLARSVELVNVLLGVWKAGAAYVPLDLSYPEQRLGFMVQDADCALVVTEPGWVDRFALMGVATIDRGRLDALARTAGRADVRPAVHPGDLAYLIYTSGSTGRPKGVAIEHSSVWSLLRWARRAFSDDELAGMLAATSVSFDLSVFEMFAPLCWGGTVVLADSVLELGQLPARDRVRLVNTVPSAMAEVLRLEELPGSVRTVALAGEVFSTSLARQLRGATGVQRVLNLYGPSEDTTYSTGAEVDVRSDARPSIGRPIDHTEVYVLDAAMEPVPQCVSGELYLGGAGVARGYHARPRATAAAFVPDPFSGRPGARLYRTGDQVRFQEDGSLDFLGRRDHQVKIRGFRIELDEIDAVLHAHEQVADSVVVAARAPAGDTRVVAYAVPEGERIDSAALLDHARRFLPTHMLPAAITTVAALPRTPNGKVDRRALPPPEWGEPGRAGPDPATPTERALASIWSDVLGLEAVDVDASFASLGGHSLLATRVVSRVRSLLGFDLGIADLFSHPTLRRLGRHLDTGADPARYVPIAPRPHPGSAPLPLSFAQQRMWFVTHLHAGETSYNVPAAIWVRGGVDAARLGRSLAAVVRRHEVLRTGFALHGGVPQQVVEPDVAVDVPVEHVPGGGDRAVLVRERGHRDAAAPFDLSRPPLFRARLLVFPDDEAALLFTVHHAVFDDWSLAVLVHDLAEHYDADGSDRRVPALPIQYGDYARWQRASPGRHDALLAWWGAYLAGAPPVLDLPTDQPRPPVPTSRGEASVFLFDDGLAAALAGLAAQQDVTPYMLLMAAFSVLVWDVSGREDVVVGTAVAGRDRLETEPLIGCFVNVVPLRTRIDPDVTFQALLQRLRADALGVFSRQELPFERLVEHLNPPRRAGVNPLVQVAFGIQNGPEASAAGAELKFDGVELEPPEARMDLTLWIDDRGGRLKASWTRSIDLFSRGTVERLHRAYEAMLVRIVEEPLTSLHALRAKDGPPTRRRELRMPDTREPSPRPHSFPGRRKPPRPITLGALVGVDEHWLGRSLPTLLRAEVADVDLAAWAAENRPLIDGNLARAGALVFKGFAVDGTAGFRRFLASLGVEILPYGERSSPRSKLAEGVYTSTDHPPDQPIVLHSEQSYTLDWPMKLIFCCDVPATRMGRTPFADTRRVLTRLSPRLVDRFEDLEVMYVRNYIPGLSLPWQEAFQTGDRREVEAYCRRTDIELEWVGDEQLRTRQVRPAVRRHPTTGERVWFNHALFFHVTSLPADVGAQLRSALDEGDLPYNSYYGNGDPIEAGTLDEIRAALEAETVSFPWERGDVLMLDNMLTAHGREPFEGQRRVLTAMADSYASVAAKAGRGAGQPHGQGRP